MIKLANLTKDLTELREGRHMYSVMAKQFRNLDNINKLVNNYLIELNYLQTCFKNCDLSNPKFLDAMINIMEFQQDFQKDFIKNINSNMEPMLNYYAPIVNLTNQMNGIKISEELFEYGDLRGKVLTMHEITKEELDEIVQLRNEIEEYESND